jgi:hypothetical protein
MLGQVATPTARRKFLRAAAISACSCPDLLRCKPDTFTEMVAALKFFSAAFIDGYARLTALPTRQNFSMRVAAGAATLHHSLCQRGEGPMQRTDRSVAILTGMIVAALYVIMLVGVSKESYMRRDAEVRANVIIARPATEDAPKRACRVEPACGADALRENSFESTR